MLEPRFSSNARDRLVSLAALALGTLLAGALGNPWIFTQGAGRASMLLAAAALVPALMVAAFTWLLRRFRRRDGAAASGAASRTEYTSSIRYAREKPLFGSRVL
ncbi:MAG TPA: hypothetical protein VFQ39_01885 [Longimicrobium sp.]|nr:hypothetical protein [Longimicrobium sp.]